MLRPTMFRQSKRGASTEKTSPVSSENTNKAKAIAKKGLGNKSAPTLKTGKVTPSQLAKTRAALIPAKPKAKPKRGPILGKPTPKKPLRVAPKNPFKAPPKGTPRQTLKPPTGRPRRSSGLAGALLRRRARMGRG